MAEGALVNGASRGTASVIDSRRSLQGTHTRKSVVIEQRQLLGLKVLFRPPLRRPISCGGSKWPTRAAWLGWGNSPKARAANVSTTDSTAESTEAILPSQPEAGTEPGTKPKSLTMVVSVATSISRIPAEDWDLCALEAAGGGGSRNPFLSHAFLSSLEDSGSAVREEGWLPQHMVARDEGGQVLGVVPMYLKGHSQGEYVFDHSWASFFHRNGVSYYPKLQSCVPFTPATGPRLLVRDGPQKAEVTAGLCQAMVQVADQFQVSSLHCTFPTQADWEAMGRQGFLRRLGVQYHWQNKNYKSFDGFLADLKSSKRKSIRQERRKVTEAGLKMLRLRGADIKAKHWDAFYLFYRNTTDHKWGTPYLTRDFFHLLGERMAEDCLLVMAEDETGRLVAGAINLIGGDTLFGRNWGCRPGVYYPNLHFEACYYQAIEAAIELGLQKVEAGAQGEHKIQRGYQPTPTYSAHYIRDPQLRGAVADFLRRETAQMLMTIELLGDHTPFNRLVKESEESNQLQLLHDLARK